MANWCSWLPSKHKTLKQCWFNVLYLLGKQVGSAGSQHLVFISAFCAWLAGNLTAIFIDCWTRHQFKKLTNHVTCLTVRVSLPIKGWEEYSCPIIMFLFRLPQLITRIISKDISPKARRNGSLIGRYLPRAEIKWACDQDLVEFYTSTYKAFQRGDRI